jgi:hypothetical protein
MLTVWVSTVLLCLPSFFRASAGFAYSEFYLLDCRRWTDFLLGQHPRKQVYLANVRKEWSTSGQFSDFPFGKRFIGQLTLARFRGDTGFGFCARLISTFLGGLVGMVMWYGGPLSRRKYIHVLSGIFRVAQAPGVPMA